MGIRVNRAFGNVWFAQNNHKHPHKPALSQLGLGYPLRFNRSLVAKSAFVKLVGDKFFGDIFRNVKFKDSRPRTRV